MQSNTNLYYSLALKSSYFPTLRTSKRQQKVASCFCLYFCRSGRCYFSSSKHFSQSQAESSPISVILSQRHTKHGDSTQGFHKNHNLSKLHQLTFTFIKSLSGKLLYKKITSPKHKSKPVIENKHFLNLPHFLAQMFSTLHLWNSPLGRCPASSAVTQALSFIEVEGEIQPDTEPEEKQWNTNNFPRCSVFV